MVMGSHVIGTWGFLLVGNPVFWGHLDIGHGGPAEVGDFRGADGGWAEGVWVHARSASAPLTVAVPEVDIR
jgi:hypothetical protein